MAKARFITLTYAGITDKGNISYKTWSISVSGKVVVTCWGRAWAAQKKKTKKFKTPALATRFAINIMDSKLKKGYKLGGLARCNPPKYRGGRGAACPCGKIYHSTGKCSCGKSHSFCIECNMPYGTRKPDHSFVCDSCSQDRQEHLRNPAYPSIPFKLTKLKAKDKRPFLPSDIEFNPSRKWYCKYCVIYTSGRKCKSCGCSKGTFKCNPDKTGPWHDGYKHGFKNTNEKIWKSGHYSIKMAISEARDGIWQYTGSRPTEYERGYFQGALDAISNARDKAAELKL